MSAFGPTASFPTAGSGASDALVASLLDGIVMSESLAASLVASLVENLNATGSPTGHLNVARTLTDSARFEDALGILLRMLLSDGLDVVGQASGQSQRLAAIADTVHALGVVGTRLDALTAAAEALALGTLLATGWRMDAVDSAAFQDALAGTLRVAGGLVDSAGFADTQTPSVRVLAIHADSLVADDDATPSMQVLASLTDEVLLYTVLRLGNVEYAGWVLNEGAPSQYTNYPFNGFVMLDGGSPLYIGTADDGIYLLDGEDDDGTDIEASIRTAMMDFGTGVLKRLPEVLVAFRGGHQMVCKVITTHPRTGAQTEIIYTATVGATGGDGLHNGVIKPGQGLTSRYWQFELVNVDGADFELDELTFRPLILDRRV